MAIFTEKDNEIAGNFCLLCINDSDRSLRASKKIFLHLISTIGERDYIKKVQIFHNDKLVFSVNSENGDNVPDSGLPVFGKYSSKGSDDYDTGWLFYPDSKRARHLQLSLQVNKPGWYKAEVILSSGTIINTGSIKLIDLSCGNIGTLQFNTKYTNLWLETCAQGWINPFWKNAMYHINAYCYCGTMIKDSYHFERIGNKNEGNNFHRPKWAKE